MWLRVASLLLQDAHTELLVAQKRKEDEAKRKEELVRSVAICFVARTHTHTHTHTHILTGEGTRDDTEEKA